MGRTSLSNFSGSTRLVGGGLGNILQVLIDDPSVNPDKFR